MLTEPLVLLWHGFQRWDQAKRKIRLASAETGRITFDCAKKIDAPEIQRTFANELCRRGGDVTFKGQER